MIRLLFTIIAGVLLGGVVHLVSVLALPRIASQDAYSRLTPITKLNTVTPLPLADPGNTLMPFMDPAFATAICRYDLSGGPIKLAVPVTQSYTSVSFYTRSDVAYYAINDRSAGKKVIELNLMTEDQHADLPEDEDVTAADRLIIELAGDHRPDRVEGAGGGARPDAAGAGRACRRELQGADRRAGGTGETGRPCREALTAALLTCLMDPTPSPDASEPRRFIALP